MIEFSPRINHLTVWHYLHISQFSSNKGKSIIFVSVNTIVSWQILVRIQRPMESDCTWERDEKWLKKWSELVQKLAHHWQNYCACTGSCPYRVVLKYHEFVICPIFCIEKIILIGAKSQMMLGKHCAYEVRFYNRYSLLLNTNKDLS
jgi:hypothetical protein